MNRYVAVGLALVVAVVGFALWSNQGSRLILNGSIQKVRLQAVDEKTTVAVADFRLRNPADYRFEVKEVQALLRNQAGEPVEGIVFRQKDLDSFLEFYKASLGPQYNETIRIGSALASGAEADYMIAVSFPVPLAEAEARQALVIRLSAIDGRQPTEIRETR